MKFGAFLKWMMFQTQSACGVGGAITSSRLSLFRRSTASRRGASLHICKYKQEKGQRTGRKLVLLIIRKVDCHDEWQQNISGEPSNCCAYAIQLSIRPSNDTRTNGAKFSAYAIDQRSSETHSKIVTIWRLRSQRNRVLSLFKRFAAPTKAIPLSEYRWEGQPRREKNRAKATKTFGGYVICSLQMDGSSSKANKY